MQEWNKNDIYRLAVSPAKRASLLAAYCDYIALIRDLEEAIRSKNRVNVAHFAYQRVYGDHRNPWQLDAITATDEEQYQRFIDNQPTDKSRNYCFVSLNLTSPNSKMPKTEIISTPDDFTYEGYGNSLPHRIERYIAAYPKEMVLKDAKFIVGGQYKIYYNGTHKDKKLRDAFQDDEFRKQMICILDWFALASEKEKYVELLPENEMLKMQNEALSSYITQDIEEIILDSLAILADETNQIIGALYAKRFGKNYLLQAQKEEVLPSASRFQDYLNIRHLVHHQWDTLDYIGKYSIGKYSDEKNKKSESIRSRFLDSYSRICDKPLSERIDSYINVAADFVPLVSILNPNIIIKGKQESNSKFIKRIRTYATSHPEAELYVEMCLPTGDKKNSQVKNIEKQFPKAKVIDKTMIFDDMTNFTNLSNAYKLRRHYIEKFQFIEYQVCQYCLYRGRNHNGFHAWEYIKKHKVITPEEAKKWAEYKKLRNDISHQHINDELIERINTFMPSLDDDAADLEKRFEARSPSVTLVEGNIYQAVHKNGMTVTIDMSEKKILNITDGSGKDKQTYNKEGTQKLRGKVYSEEYNNDISITTRGTEVLACRLHNGIAVDFTKKYIKYDYNTVLYFSNPNRRYLCSKLGEKIFMDKNFRVINYVRLGKSIEVMRGECYHFAKTHMVTMGRDQAITQQSWVDAQGKKVILNYKKDASGITLSLNDQTAIKLDNDNHASVFHNGIKLSYETRKNFAESYQENTLNPTVLLKQHEGRK